MDVVFGVDWDVEVEDVAQAADVDATGSDVTADEQAEFAGLEFGQRGETLGLAHVAVERSDAHAVALERFVEDIDVALAIAENERVLDVFALDEAAEGFALVEVVDDGQAGDDGGRDAGWAADGDFLRLAEEGVGEAADFGGHGGAKEEGLAALGEEADDLFDVGG